MLSRIIPARAGFTGCEIWAVKMKEDHPRSRGVYVPPTAHNKVAFGSSPLARGLLVGRLFRVRIWRIIPARAGFTSLYQAGRKGESDHPRSRGVYHERGRH